MTGSNQRPNLRRSTRLSFPSTSRLSGILVLLFLLGSSAGFAQLTVDEAGPSWLQSGISTLNMFSKVNSAPGINDQDRIINATDYNLVKIDMSVMDQVVEATRQHILDDERKVITLMYMPMPDGTLHGFDVWYDPIMHEDLAIRFPEITTFRGVSKSDPATTIRMDKTPQGVHAIIFDGHSTIYLDPYAKGNTEYYIAYDKSDFIPHPSKQRNELGVIDLHDHDDHVDQAASGASGETLRTYRLALACTGEYASFHGGTVSGVLAAMNTSMNRVNGIYERELGVRMEIIADNDQLIFLNAGTDPYTNADGFIMLSQNQSTISSIIGNSNYDIGHVFSTGGGGIAALGSVCSNSSKAEGVTGLFSPVGDPFDVDYVAHEIGHQFRGQHIWNFCFGGLGSSIGYEPGSGTTIMGYAGLCGSTDNIQNNSDDYFHVGNLQEMINFITSGGGSSCGVSTPSGNSVPTVDAGDDGFTIPIETPFELIGSGEDADPSNQLTYCWEQYDLGPNVSWVSPAGNSPLFRSFPPTEEPIRVFPQMQSILDGSTSRGEYLPDYDRNMRFRLTVRDNDATSGGVAWEQIALAVNSTGGPFTVTEPAGPSVTWEVFNWVPVTWEPGSTMDSPFDVETVSIFLSTDGGQTFPHQLASTAENNGLTYVFVPDLETTEARIKVKGNNNVFFNVNDNNFRIENTGNFSSVEDINVLPVTMFPNPATEVFQLQLSSFEQVKGDLVVRVYDAFGRIVTERGWTGNAGSMEVQIQDWATGMYMVELLDDSGSRFARKLLVR